jgi:hypothetical protein
MIKILKRLSLAKRPDTKDLQKEDVEISGPTGFTRTVRGSLNEQGELLGQEELLKAMEAALANNQPVTYDSLMKMKKQTVELKQEEEEEEENPVQQMLREQKEREKKLKEQ